MSRALDAAIERKSAGTDELIRPYYEQDGITIYCGDSREIDAWDIAGAVMVTDPPYGIDHSSNRPQAPRRGSAIEGDDSVRVRDEVLALWGGRPAIVFGTCRAPAPSIAVRATLVWDKGGHVGMGDLSLPWKQNWEHIYVAGPGFIGRRGSGVLHYSALQPVAKYDHPHEKPIGLMRDLIGKCPPLAVVVDPFMGTGTTLRAAKDYGRAAVGIEIEERYCELAVKRLAQGVMV